MNARPRRRARMFSVVVALTLVGLTACTQQPPEPIPTGPTSSEEPTDQDDVGAPSDPAGEHPSAAPIAVDWTDRAAVVLLDNGWDVAHCEGDAPLLCVHDGDTLLGVIEAAAWPVDDDLAAVLDAQGLDAALARHVADFHLTFAVDRVEGCGEDYEYVAHETEHVRLAGNPAVRYGFSGVVDGVEVERSVSFVAILDGELTLVTAAANAPGSCMHSDGFVELTPEDLATLEPYLTSLAAGSVLPPSGPALDG